MTKFALIALAAVLVGEYTMDELKSVLIMQGFAGISQFSVFLLMALGLAIIFGQMGVINMAHGEFMTIGAYATVGTAILFERFLPAGLFAWYFPLAVVAAFGVAFIIGWLTEFFLIRHLYHRPLDTLLATWGLSMILQETFRQTFGARETSATMPDWLLGSWVPSEGVDIPINGLFLLGVTAVMTTLVYVLMFRSRWGLRVRATVLNRTMAGAVGIDTKGTDRMTFALGCGIAGIAGAAFTTIGSVSPTAGGLYIVDTFLVVVFGGAGSLLGTILSAFGIAQAQSITEFFLSGVLAKVLILTSIIVILMIRPQGLIAAKIRK